MHMTFCFNQITLCMAIHVIRNDTCFIFTGHVSPCIVWNLKNGTKNSVLKALLYAMATPTQFSVQLCRQNDQSDMKVFCSFESSIKVVDNIFGNIFFSWLPCYCNFYFFFAFKPKVCEMDGNFQLQNRLNLLCSGIALWPMSKKRHTLVST